MRIINECILTGAWHNCHKFHLTSMTFIMEVVIQTFHNVCEKTLTKIKILTPRSGRQCFAGANTVCSLGGGG